MPPKSSTLKISTLLGVLLLGMGMQPELAAACTCDEGCTVSGSGPDVEAPVNFMKLDGHSYCVCTADSVNGGTTGEGAGVFTIPTACSGGQPDKDSGPGSALGGAASADATSPADATPATLQTVAAVKQELASGDQAMATTVAAASGAATGAQMESLSVGNDVSVMGANHAATSGAISCAAGANVHLESADVAAPLYASCQQYFTVAKTMGSNITGFTPDKAVLAGEGAQQTLTAFEKNFGVSSGDYIGRMLGKNGGRGALEELVGGKIANGPLAEAFSAADKIAPSSILEDTNKFAVNFDAAKTKAKPPTSLRDSLKKKLAGAHSAEVATAYSEESRKPASSHGELEDLTPSHEAIFASASESEQELTIFDVVHMKYGQLFKDRH
jgi:hypothetical protein